MCKKLRTWFGNLVGNLVGNTDPKVTENMYYLFVTALGFTTLVAFVAALVFFKRCSFPPTDVPMCSFGEIGDFIGGILNPILTFLAFMGLLITIAVQKDELKQTREQLRSAAKSQQEIAELQKEDLNDSNIFRLLESLRQTEHIIQLDIVTRSAQFQDQLRVVSGVNACAELLEECILVANKLSKNNGDKEAVQIAANRKYNKLGSKMGSYFEQVKYILWWIDNPIVTISKRQDYIALLAANMSYQAIFLTYLYSMAAEQEELLAKLNTTQLINYVPNYGAIFDKVLRK